MVCTQPAVIAASTAERIADAAARQAVYAYRGVVAPTLDDDVIEPFVLDAPSVVLNDLGQRVATAQASREAGGSRTGDASTSPRVGALLDRWTGGYDWAAQEARLNAVPQFTTTIDGAPLHFFHVESPRACAPPMLLRHEWPGSISACLGLIGPLTDPAAHGLDPKLACDVVIPAPPGVPLSGPTDDDWSVDRVDRAFTALMARLRYDDYRSPEAGAARVPGARCAEATSPVAELALVAGCADGRGLPGTYDDDDLLTTTTLRWLARSAAAV